MADGTYSPGLKGVVAAKTNLSSVDGLAGELIIRGYHVEELAPKATFEEVIQLLWHDKLPTAAELASFTKLLAGWRTLPPITMDVLRQAAAQKVEPMDALRMAVGTLDLKTDDEPAVGGEPRGAMVTAGRIPTIVASYWRLLNGNEPIAPNGDLSHAANYLYMLTGEIPHPQRTRALETYLNTVVDHGLNASTFTARVIISTASDLVSAITGGVGSLKGPLHGGAPGPALDMVIEIGEESKAEPYLREKLGRGELLMGFGHRVYKVRDPRAEVLGPAAEALYMAAGDRKLYDLARYVETMAVKLLEEYKPGRNLQTNVEFYTALLLHGLELPTALFAPTFAIGRVIGWLAHCFEQQSLKEIIRPDSIYTGPKDREWVPIEERS